MVSKESKNIARVRRHARVRAKISGTPECPRLCVYRSNKNIEAQLMAAVNRCTLAASSSMALRLANGSNIEAATKVGEDLAKRALAKGLKKVVFDRSGYVYHGRIKALAEAAREAGLEF